MMISTSQLDTISGIVCHYENYVVYYTSTYNSGYTQSEIDIFVGSEITYASGVWTFGDDCQHYRLTQNKYYNFVGDVSGSSWGPSEPAGLVYTNTAAHYPEIAFVETRIENFDYSKFYLAFSLICLGSAVLLCLLFRR